MSYRDELEAARARSDALERDLVEARATERELRARLKEARAAGRSTPDPRATSSRPRWLIATSAGSGLTVISLSIGLARWRGLDAFNQLMSGFSAFGGAFMVGMGTLMILDASPLENAEERRKRRWGFCLLALGIGFTAWMVRTPR
jgi:hypothetical protein